MPNLYVMAGCSGSGKSQKAEELSIERGIPIIGADQIRLDLSIREGRLGVEYIFNRKLRQRVERLVNEALWYASANNTDIIFDATNLTVQRRMEVLELFQGYSTTLYVFKPDRQMLRDRNDHRNLRYCLNLINFGLKGIRGVNALSLAYIDEQIQKFQMPTTKEGFSNIIVLNSSPPPPLLNVEIANFELAQTYKKRISEGPADFGATRLEIIVELGLIVDGKPQFDKIPIISASNPPKVKRIDQKDISYTHPLTKKQQEQSHDIVNMLQQQSGSQIGSIKSSSEVAPPRKDELTSANTETSKKNKSQEFKSSSKVNESMANSLQKKGKLIARAKTDIDAKWTSRILKAAIFGNKLKTSSGNFQQEQDDHFVRDITHGRGNSL